MKAFKDKLNKRYSVRGHLTLILLTMFAFGLVLGRGLLYLGMTNFVVRDLLVIAASYLFFFVLVRLWIEIIKSDPAVLEVPESDLRSDPASVSEMSVEKGKTGGGWPWLDAFPFDMGEGFSIFLLLLVVLCLLIWAFVEGPVILTEVAFEVALTASLARAAKSRSQGPWYQGLLWRTAAVFFIVWIGGTIALAFIDRSCPGQTRLSEVAKACWFRK